ncbi:5839_t:CDS:2, partial [Dentiscutata erythropus]
MNNEIPFENDNRIITKWDKFLGILYGIGYNINYIIGAGIFNSNSIWRVVQSPGIALMLYVGCGIISLLGSLIYIEANKDTLPMFFQVKKEILDIIILPGEIVADSYISAQYLLYAIRGGSFNNDYDL